MLFVCLRKTVLELLRFRTQLLIRLKYTRRQVRFLSMENMCIDSNYKSTERPSFPSVLTCSSVAREKFVTLFIRELLTLDLFGNTSSDTNFPLSKYRVLRNSLSEKKEGYIVAISFDNVF